MKVVGVDIGGTSITAGLVEDQGIISTTVSDTLSHRAKNEILDDLFQVLSKIITPDTRAIGIGVPGVVDTDKGVIHEIINIPAWKNFPLKEKVETEFGLPVLIENDANCFALAIHHFGTGKNYRDIVGISIGTGLGAGIIINGKLYSGVKSGAGEFGQLPYKAGIFEDYCSGKFFLAGNNLSGADAYQKACRGEKEALDTWFEFGTHIGKLLQLVIYALAPELIILGGSVSKGFDFFRPSMLKVLDGCYLQGIIRNTRIEADLNSLNPLLGAAALCYVE